MACASGPIHDDEDSHRVVVPVSVLQVFAGDESRVRALGDTRDVSLLLTGYRTVQGNEKNNEGLTELLRLAGVSKLCGAIGLCTQGSAKKTQPLSYVDSYSGKKEECERRHFVFEENGDQLGKKWKSLCKFVQEQFVEGLDKAQNGETPTLLINCSSGRGRSALISVLLAVRFGQASLMNLPNAAVLVAHAFGIDIMPTAPDGKNGEVDNLVKQMHVLASRDEPAGVDMVKLSTLWLKNNWQLIDRERRTVSSKLEATHAASAAASSDASDAYVAAMCAASAAVSSDASVTAINAASAAASFDTSDASVTASASSASSNAAVNEANVNWAAASASRNEVRHDSLLADEDSEARSSKRARLDRDQAVAAARLFDLAHTLTDQAPAPANLHTPIIGTSIHHVSDNVRRVMSSHILPTTSCGTYLESPRSFSADGANLAAVPIGQIFRVNTVLLDLRKLFGPDVSQNTYNLEITDLDIQAAFEDPARCFPNSARQASAFVICTGWDQVWDSNPARYCSNATPHLTHRAARYLLSLGARFVGIDAIDVDNLDDAECPVHLELLQFTCLVCKNMRLTELANYCCSNEVQELRLTTIPPPIPIAAYHVRPVAEASCGL